MTPALSTRTRIRASIERVREQMAHACARCGRDPVEITLIAASKTRTAAEVVAAAEAGVVDFGENYVQEGAAKFAEVLALAPGIEIRRHCIGHLQRNKVNAGLEAFEVFHGIDSLRTLEALAHKSARSVPVFVEVNLAGEPSKHGVTPSDLPEVLDRARPLEMVRVLGLMTIPPPGPAADTRAWFARLRELAHGLGLRHLSMGMTDDFEVAIEEGTTHIRVGRAIFGDRNA
jgi:hypothetical protein